MLKRTVYLTFTAGVTAKKDIPDYSPVTTWAGSNPLYDKALSENYIGWEENNTKQYRDWQSIESLTSFCRNYPMAFKFEDDKWAKGCFDYDNYKTSVGNSIVQKEFDIDKEESNLILWKFDSLTHRYGEKGFYPRSQEAVLNPLYDFIRIDPMSFVRYFRDFAGGHFYDYLKQQEVTEDVSISFISDMKCEDLIGCFKPIEFVIGADNGVMATNKKLLVHPRDYMHDSDDGKTCKFGVTTCATKECQPILGLPFIKSHPTNIVFHKNQTQTVLFGNEDKYKDEKFRCVPLGDEPYEEPIGRPQLEPEQQKKAPTLMSDPVGWLWFQIFSFVHSMKLLEQAFLDLPMFKFFNDIPDDFESLLHGGSISHQHMIGYFIFGLLTGFISLTFLLIVTIAAYDYSYTNQQNHYWPTHLFG